jgi:uncharacterized oxidoreductase
MKTSGNKIVITGGASGIGFALAERFVADGNTVIACGRRVEALSGARAKLPSLVTRVCDVETSTGREELFRWVQAEHGDANVLVNNAGIQNWMGISDDNFMARARQEIAINIEAPLHLANLFLGHRALDTIVNVTSGLAFVPFIKVPVYSATKAFLHSFTLSLRELCRAKNVEVIELIPPALNTDLGGKGLHDHAPPVKDFIEAVFAQLREGKTTATFDFTEGLSRAAQDAIQPIFKKLNQLG